MHLPHIKILNYCNNHILGLLLDIAKSQMRFFNLSHYFLLKITDRPLITLITPFTWRLITDLLITLLPLSSIPVPFIIFDVTFFLRLLFLHHCFRNIIYDQPIKCVPSRLCKWPSAFARNLCQSRGTSLRAQR